MKLLYCFGIFITFALQFYVPAEILIPPVVARVSARWERPVDLLLRSLLVVFTCKYKQEGNVCKDGKLLSQNVLCVVFSNSSLLDDKLEIGLRAAGVQEIEILL